MTKPTDGGPWAFGFRPEWTLLQKLPEESQSVLCQCVLGGGQRAPDGRGGGDALGLGGEALDHRLVRVIHFLQALGHALPVDVLAAAGGAAVVLAGVEVQQPAAGPLDRVVAAFL